MRGVAASAKWSGEARDEKLSWRLFTRHLTAESFYCSPLLRVTQKVLKGVNGEPARGLEARAKSLKFAFVFHLPSATISQITQRKLVDKVL